MTRLRLLALAFAALVFAGCGGGDDASGPAAQPDTSEPAEEGSKPAENEKSGDQIWLTTGEQLKPVERDLHGGGSEVQAAAKALVEGPTEKEAGGGIDAATQIPDGVDVHSVEVSGDGTALVEVSKSFLKGIPATPGARDAAQEEALDARLSQVTYTLTQFEGVESAKVVAGGISAGPPTDRSDFAKPSGGPPPITKAKGSPSSGTTAVQKRLVKLNYLPAGAIDGLNGYRTQQAVMAFQSWEGLTRDGIVGPQTQAALADAKEPKPGKTGAATRIEVYRSKGVALLIQDGKTKRAIHVSAGAPATPTPSGSYSVFRKEKNSWSVPFQQWLPLASYFNAGIAFHEYAQVPSYPASHGCVRVPTPEARFVYGFAKIGTAVVVY
jgi:lipoprotein-anchoring transpeptidase ErfK/SrfK